MAGNCSIARVEGRLSPVRERREVRVTFKAPGNSSEPLTFTLSSCQGERREKRTSLERYWVEAQYPVAGWTQNPF